MSLFGRDGQEVVRRQIIETITDDLRDRRGYVVGASETGIISLLVLPKPLFARAFAGGVFDFKVHVLDRDTRISPEVLLVRSITHVLGEPSIRSADGVHSTIPIIVQDAWYRSPVENLSVFFRLIQIPGKELGSLTAGLLRTTARALLWTSAARAHCFGEFSDETMECLARIANSKGHAPPYWLAKQAQMVLRTMGPRLMQFDAPEAQAGLVVVENAVRQEAAGVRIPRQPTATWPGDPGTGGNIGHSQSPGGNSLTGRPGSAGTFTDNRIADGDIYDLVNAYREPPAGFPMADERHSRPASEDDHDLIGLEGIHPDPEELAALERLQNNDMSISEKPKKPRRKSKPDMFNLRPGSGPRRRPSGPRIS